MIETGRIHGSQAHSRLSWPSPAFPLEAKKGGEESPHSICLSHLPRGILTILQGVVLEAMTFPGIVYSLADKCGFLLQNYLCALVALL
jgi:hypothetical protein